jgi:4-hydroxybenzoate polyprenyltransferase
MSAKVPGFSNYQTEPFTLAVDTTPATFGSLLGGWSPDMGSTAILVVQMPADGESVALCIPTFSGTVADIPDNALIKAKQDTATSVAFGLTSLPIRYTDAAGSNVALVASSSFSAVCQWLPITEPGD